MTDGEYIDPSDWLDDQWKATDERYNFDNILDEGEESEDGNN